MTIILQFFELISSTFGSSPFLPYALFGVGALAIFLIFFATRDILLRTHSFLLQFFCIVLVALLPGVGFLLYLLIRPSRTLHQREMQEALYHIRDLLEQQGTPVHEKPKPANDEEHHVLAEIPVAEQSTKSKRKAAKPSKAADTVEEPPETAGE